jgi:transposase
VLAIVWQLLKRALWKELTESHTMAAPVTGTGPYLHHPLGRLQQAGGHPTQWAAVRSIAAKIGCSAEALRGWVRQAERDAGQRPGLTSDEAEELKTLRREVRELRRANEILRKASAYFAQAELDRPPR